MTSGHEPEVIVVGLGAMGSATCFQLASRGVSVLGRFVIDRHPVHDPVVIVSPCSGHGFKHSPAIGEAITQWVTRRRSEIDLSAFSLSRARR